jgi:hypothetical protein
MMNLYVIHGMAYNKQVSPSKLFLAPTKETACVLYYENQEDKHQPVQLIIELLAGKDNTLPGEE